MAIESRSASPKRTQEIAAEFAQKLFTSTPIFIRLKGEMGAGKSEFARGFIKKWLELSCEAAAESIVSPTFNIARVYGAAKPIAHLDLYRMQSMQELEQLGFEHYFYELPCCLVEWLERIENPESVVPERYYIVEIEHGASPEERIIRFQERLKSP
ncbi:MAG: tRNA (adenosine(37)-N6)-threonylcarbamoyltransferase complex ATPase subunit type 1 TsaE [Bdellovibrionota bacterium]